MVRAWALFEFRFPRTQLGATTSYSLTPPPFSQSNPPRSTFRTLTKELTPLPDSPVVRQNHPVKPPSSKVKQDGPSSRRHHPRTPSKRPPENLTTTSSNLEFSETLVALETVARLAMALERQGFPTISQEHTTISNISQVLFPHSSSTPLL